MSARVSIGGGGFRAPSFSGSDVPGQIRKGLQQLLIETASYIPDAIAYLQPDDRRQFSEQILAIAHSGAEVSKQIAALENTVGGYIAQLEQGSGGGDHTAVLHGLQAAVNSSQAQNAAVATIDIYNDNLRRLVSNLKKHTSAADDDEIVFQDSVSINTICPVLRCEMTHYIDLESAKAILKIPKKNKQTGRFETLCPVPGCKSPFVESDLLMAPEVEHAIQRQRDSGPSQRMSQSQHASKRRNIDLGDD